MRTALRVRLATSGESILLASKAPVAIRAGLVSAVSIRTIAPALGSKRSEACDEIDACRPESAGAFRHLPTRTNLHGPLAEREFGIQPV